MPKRQWKLAHQRPVAVVALLGRAALLRRHPHPEPIERGAGLRADVEDGPVDRVEAFEESTTQSIREMAEIQCIAVEQAVK